MNSKNRFAKGILFLGSILLIFNTGCVRKHRSFASDEINLLPQPNEVTISENSFALKDGMDIGFSDNATESMVSALSDQITQRTGLKLSVSNNGQGDIVLTNIPVLGEDAYQLDVNPEKINISASTSSGFFYGIETLKQLLTKDTEESVWLIPSITIKDAPRFGWRAYMLDESRYFHGADFVKQTLDQMASLKMNVFHWHLTDDAGWRIEIKKYPKLTKVGSFRTDSEIGTWKSGKLSGEPHGGFYSQEEIKELVAYAAERHITIVPEFEIPGHSSAAIAAYTWLGTAGKDIDVPVKFGRHYDNYDVTNPKVEQFVKDVLLELFELFPSEVVHIGGDEVGYEVWNESRHVQEYMKEHGIKTAADLQIQFTNKISKFIEQHGRRMMGWNEIMGKNIHGDFEEKKHDEEAETELAKNTVVHFWKGDLNLATEAAQKGYGIVNSLHSNTYLDYNYNSISLEKAYGFNPIPEGLEPQYHKNIYGLGCQMWSEWTPTNKDVEHQTFPRIAAYAEVGWTNPENKNFKSFKTALEIKQKEWDTLGINYAKVLEE
ncbi:beta-N-acetylhexosaminidase [Flagellimonas pacifica]|uniref:beta-N-acetylhexosaminidase n=1 Tax=Flagellimonas pacifica TaxID=1247520 RepID=A0A285MTP0_9FLAO|nr:beta-N-acetylhexosaminidase [Allomuricauda parva]SNZ00544.1 hexosaminidase [Allomuricauda parva]